jgi:hypothetical protein
VNTEMWAVSDIYVGKSKGHTEIKRHWKNLKIIFVACGIKVSIHFKERIWIRHTWIILWNFLKILRWTVVTDLEWNTKILKSFCGISFHSRFVSTVARLVVIVKVSSLLPHATRFSNFCFQWCKFNFRMPFLFC